MSILEKLNAVKDTVPHYWPIGAFIHHNPLKGFEHLNFKEGLEKAQGIFGGQVYMKPDYYVNLYKEGKITSEALEKNLERCLKNHEYKNFISEATSFLLETSPKWTSLRNYEALKINEIDEELHAYLEKDSIYMNKEAWIEDLTKYMTFYEIHDALFGTTEKELIEKDVIEFVARFLDNAQTTLSMQDRELGMFDAFNFMKRLTMKVTLNLMQKKCWQNSKLMMLKNTF